MLLYTVPDLPKVLSVASEYSSLDLVKILANFFVYQKSWPEANTKTNCWNEITQKTAKELNFVLPSRAVFSSSFGCFENAIDLATRYLSGQDISSSSLLQPITEEDIWPDTETPVTLEQLVDLFINYYEHFGEYPSTGPSTWNRNTLFRCKTYGLKLPPFRRCVSKLGGMTFIKSEAEKMRRSFKEEPEELSSIIECEVLGPESSESDSLQVLLDYNQSLQSDIEKSYIALDSLITKNKELEQENYKLKNSNDFTKNNLALNLLFSKATLETLEFYNHDKNISLIINLLKEASAQLNINL